MHSFWYNTRVWRTVRQTVRRTDRSYEWLSVCLSVCLSDCLSVCLTVCLSVWLSVCLSVCLSVRPSVLSVRPSVRPSVCQSVTLWYYIKTTDWFAITISLSARTGMLRWHMIKIFRWPHLVYCSFLIIICTQMIPYRCVVLIQNLNIHARYYNINLDCLWAISKRFFFFWHALNIYAHML